MIPAERPEPTPERTLDDESWEAATDELLAESPYDTELGKEMARDAIRVSYGKMSETEFQEKYHDAVVDEFGIDERPVQTENNNE